MPFGNLLSLVFWKFPDGDGLIKADNDGFDGVGPGRILNDIVEPLE